MLLLPSFQTELNDFVFTLLDEEVSVQIRLYCFGNCHGFRRIV